MWYTQSITMPTCEGNLPCIMLGTIVEADGANDISILIHMI